MLSIDGSQGEGGGQILRSALALSLITGQPFRISSIRSGRRKPGLMRQHLTAVNAAATVGGADVAGAALGSLELSFAPREVRPGDYTFEVGTAGSTTLVLQTILPALLQTADRSSVTLSGGTHNPNAPPFDFLQSAFLPIINRMGPSVSAKLKRPGFFPAGGGHCTVSIKPVAGLRPIELRERGHVQRIRGRAVIAHLSRHIAERELKRIGQRMGLSGVDLEVVEVDDAAGPGNVVTIAIESEHITELFTSFGERGVRAESVADDVAEQAQRYLDSGAPVGQHLADQLLLPLVLAGAGSFRTARLTLHAETNLNVIERFLGRRIDVEDSPDGTVVVRAVGRPAGTPPD